jgi:hypothetical protein
MYSSISNVAVSPLAGPTSWAFLAHFKKDTPSPSVGSFHVKDRQKHSGVTNGEVTSPGNKKGNHQLVVEGVMRHL